MSTTWTFSADDIAPAPETVYGLQGIPKDAPIPERVEALFATSLVMFRATVEAQGIMAPIAKEAFAKIYAGEGRNEPITPVGGIFPQADDLALFAVTLGPRISAEIDERFRVRDVAVASMLDAIASAAADRTAERLQHRYEEALAPVDQTERRRGVLRYSPGYCGWHVSGQRKLFDYLRPERIGLSLRTSFLMEPLKSVSGVFIAGPREIHEFPDAYDFCNNCDAHGCRERIESLYEDPLRSS